MSNTLTAVTPKLLAQGLLALREQAFMPQLVNRRYDDMAGQRGSSIDVPIPSAISAIAVTPANTPPSTAEIAPTSVSVPMDQWYEAAFELTDKDILEAMDGVIPMQASEAIKAIANNINTYILQKMYQGFYGYTGVAGQTPFSNGTVDATNARKLLNKQLAPLTDRHFVVDPDAEGNLLNLQAFQDTSWAGSPAVITEATINRKIGFDWWPHQLVPTHTAGTITTGLIAKAATPQAVGLTSIVATTAASTGAAALLVGDVISIAGSTQTYVLTAVATQASAASDVTLAIDPPLKKALAGSEAITVKPTHVNNLAFHRDAFAFATRPMQGVPAGLGSIVRSESDPMSGLTLRLEITREHKRTRFSYDVLYGGKVVRSALGVRVSG